MNSYSAEQARARKQQIRSQIRRDRKLMDVDQRKRETDLILREIAGNKPYQSDFSEGPRTLLFYMPMPEEVDVVPLIEHALRNGDRVLLPRVTDDARMMTLHVIHSLAELEEKRRGWFEPKLTTPQWPIEKRLDGIIIPGVAFDRQGGRIGYGGGYYDTLLQQLETKQKKPWTLAPAFLLQIVDEIPREPHDQRIDYLATSRGIVTCMRE